MLLPMPVVDVHFALCLIVGLKQGDLTFESSKIKFIAFVDLDEHMVTVNQETSLVQLLRDLYQNDSSVVQYMLPVR